MSEGNRQEGRIPARAIIYCLIVTTIFSCHYIVAKEVLRSVPPLPFIAVRGIFGGLLLFVIFRKKIIAGLSLNVFKNIAIIALLGFFLNQILFMYGLKNTSSINASIINNTIPIFTVLFSILFMVEKFSLKRGIGILLGFSLVLSLILLGRGTDIDVSVIGDSLVFLNVISFSVAFVLVKKMLGQEVPSELISSGMLILGGFYIFLISFYDLPKVFSYTFSSNRTLSLMIFEVVVSTAFVYWLNFKALKLIAPSQANIFIYFQPPITATIAFILFGTAPSWVTIPIFLGVVFSGYLVLSRPRQNT